MIFLCLFMFKITQEVDEICWQRQSGSFCGRSELWLGSLIFTILIIIWRKEFFEGFFPHCFYVVNLFALF